MKKFMVLYMAPTSAIEQMSKATPAQMKAGMDEWMSWADKNRRTLVDLGAPLGKTKKVTSAGVSDTRNEITGYAIVQGDSLDAVARTFANHPHFKMGGGASIEIIEALSIPQS